MDAEQLKVYRKKLENIKELYSKHISIVNNNANVSIKVY